ncbi:hypothetical protein ACWEJP_20965 [Streptomyces sp. NPDC004749]
MSEPDIRAEVAVQHRHTAIEVRLFHPHICQPDPLFPPAQTAAQIEPAFDTREVRSPYDEATSKHTAHHRQQAVIS